MCERENETRRGWRPEKKGPISPQFFTFVVMIQTVGKTSSQSKAKQKQSNSKELKPRQNKERKKQEGAAQFSHIFAYLERYERQGKECGILTTRRARLRSRHEVELDKEHLRALLAQLPMDPRPALVLYRREAGEIVWNRVRRATSGEGA